MLRVAFQGERGAYSEEAIAALWPVGAEPVPVRTFTEVLRLVEGGGADAGVIPVENSLVGEVHDGVAALAGAPGVRTVAETVVTIRHCLLATPGATLESLRRVESHPVALAQCRDFLARHRWLTPVESFDTAGAARDVAAALDPARSAIAGRVAAERYALAVVAEGIADRPDNRTRFVAVRRRADAASG